MASLRIAIRTDASKCIGTGHVMRCLSLAETLSQQGAKVLFISRDLPGNLNAFINKKGFDLCRLPVSEIQDLNLDWNRHATWLGVPWRQDAEETLGYLQNWGKVDLLVIDHYALEAGWEVMLRPVVNRILVIDDLADRPHDCDFLLDQNFFCGFEKRYEKLVPVHCQKLLGPRYALLRPDFREVRATRRLRTGDVKKILVFFGSTDPTDETTKALEAIRLLDRADISVDVVVGIGNQKKETIQRRCKALPQTHFYCQVDNMAELLADADLSLGAGGSTTWERFAVGTPSLLIAVAHNQEEHSQDLGSKGLVVYLGRSDQVDRKTILKQLERMLLSPSRLLAMESAGLKLVDGLGTKRVTGFLLTTAGEN